MKRNRETAKRLFWLQSRITPAPRTNRYGWRGRGKFAYQLSRRTVGGKSAYDFEVMELMDEMAEVAYCRKDLSCVLYNQKECDAAIKGLDKARAK